MSEERRARARSFHRISDAYLIATILPLAILIGYGLGWVVDRFAGTAQWGRWIGGVLGVVAGSAVSVTVGAVTSSCRFQITLALC